MLIRELFEDESEDLSLKLSAVVNQIASRVIDTGANSKTSLSSILNKLSDVGINLTDSQFRDMADNEPLNNIIANVAGDEVTFIGQRKDKSMAVDTDKSSATLEKMAKRAEKKISN